MACSLLCVSPTEARLSKKQLQQSRNCLREKNICPFCGAASHSAARSGAAADEQLDLPPNPEYRPVITVVNAGCPSSGTASFMDGHRRK
jgi:ribosomal protein S27AE